MFQRRRKYYLFRNESYFSILFSCFFSLISALFQGCSSDMDSVKIKENHADKQIESIGAPKLFLEKSLYDFGEITPNDKKTAVFKFSNLGDQPLLVKDIKRCCGVVAKVDKKELAPGESGTLTVEYQTSIGSGVFKRQVGLITNDPKSPQALLTFTGKVIRTLTWSPAKIELNPYKQTDVSPEITIKSLNDTPFSVKGFKATGGSFSAEFDPAKKATEFTLKPKLDTAKLETLPSNRGIITIDLEHPDYKNINLKFNVIPSLQAVPSSILVFNAKANEPVRKPLILQNNADPEKDITDLLETVISKNGSKVDVLEFTRLEKGCKLDLEIWPSNNESSVSFSQDELVFKMKDGRELDVPVRVFYSTRTLSSKTDQSSNI